MRKLLLVAALVLGLFIVSRIYAQNAAANGYQYCEYIWTHEWGTFRKQNSGTIYFGNGKTESYNQPIADALNYLGKKGWELTAAQTVEYEGLNEHRYTFKKKF